MKKILLTIRKINNINNYGNTWYMNNSNIMVNNANKYIGNNNWNNNFNNININLNYNINNNMNNIINNNKDDNFNNKITNSINNK